MAQDAAPHGIHNSNVLRLTDQRLEELEELEAVFPFPEEEQEPHLFRDF